MVKSGFLRPYFPLIRGMFVFRSWLRFLWGKGHFHFNTKMTLSSFTQFFEPTFCQYLKFLWNEYLFVNIKINIYCSIFMEKQYMESLLTLLVLLVVFNQKKSICNTHLSHWRGWQRVRQQRGLRDVVKKKRKREGERDRDSGVAVLLTATSPQLLSSISAPTGIHIRWLHIFNQFGCCSFGVWNEALKTGNEKAYKCPKIDCQRETLGVMK